MRVKANAVPNSAEEHVIYDASTGSVDVTNAANGGADIFTKDSVNSDFGSCWQYIGSNQSGW